MTPEQARRNNSAQTARIEQSIRRLAENIANRALPAVLDDIGKLADEHSENTKTYQDRTGNLRSGYAHVIVPPNSSAELRWDSQDGGGSTTITNDRSEVLLVHGNPVPYAIFVELKNGLDVSIQTFLFLRRELRTMLVSKLRAFKIF